MLKRYAEKRKHITNYTISFLLALFYSDIYFYCTDFSTCQLFKPLMPGVH